MYTNRSNSEEPKRHFGKDRLFPAVRPSQRTSAHSAYSAVQPSSTKNLAKTPAIPPIPPNSTFRSSQCLRGSVVIHLRPSWQVCADNVQIIAANVNAKTALNPLICQHLDNFPFTCSGKLCADNVTAIPASRWCSFVSIRGLLSTGPSRQNRASKMLTSTSSVPRAAAPVPPETLIKGPIVPHCTAKRKNSSRAKIPHFAAPRSPFEPSNAFLFFVPFYAKPGNHIFSRIFPCLKSRTGHQSHRTISAISPAKEAYA